MTKPAALPAAANTGRRPLHIFKSGQWTTMAGEVIEFSQADIEATAKAYNPSLGKAPIVIGHPATDDPAKGWAQSLIATTRGLFAEPAKVDPAFAEEVRTGRWGTVSSKFYRPNDANNPVPGVWYLRHIGFLGAQNPAVKGLDDPEFANVDDGCVCFQEGVAFGEWDGMTNASLWRGLREWIIGKFGADEADKVLPGYAVRDLELGAHDDIKEQQLADARPSAFANPEETPAVSTDTPSQPPKESDVTEEEAARLREEGIAKDRLIADLQAKSRASAAATVLAENTAFAEQMAAEARILPTQVAQVAAIAGQLQATPVDFSDGDVKKPLNNVFQDFVRSLPAKVLPGEQATRVRAAGAADDADSDVAFSEGADPERLKQHKAALAYAKEHKTSYAAAARAVIK